jgi:choice-of-anchor B domain-containing protein
MLVIAFVLFLLAGPVFAHGDAELPLYVSESGADAGDCLQAANPCASISYALSRAGKGGQIRVAAGTYAIADAEDVFHLVSGVVSVSGGYEVGFSDQAGSAGVSTLTGVPFQYRELLEGSGFSIVQDQKGSDPVSTAEADKLLALHQSLKSSIAATPCIGGSAAGLPCSDVDLLSHVGFDDVSRRPSYSNDIWGFVDLNTGREYALVGFSLGTAVFDVTDATNPREVGFVDGQPATWRDIKVYQFFDEATGRYRAYGYVTTDGSTDGLFVIDLTELPHSISQVNYASDIFRAHNVYATNTDFSTGLSLTGAAPTLILAGSNISGGRYRTYSLANPLAPTLVNGGTGNGYMHDAASLNIADSRKDNQCQHATDICELLLDFNENAFEIWDVTDAASPLLLSERSYPNVGYIHSGWWSEDKQYIFVHDELDERNSGLATTLRVFSIADVRNPTQVGAWTGPTRAIDHNGFVRGNRYYMSNYTRGLTILDISNAASPVAVGGLDTYPASDGTMFNGAWGAYPYFFSGNVAISDIDSGFYMAADRTRDVAQGMLQFEAASFAGVEGQQAALSVERVGGSSGAVSVDYEIVRARADVEDYAPVSGTLSWPAGDASSKNLLIDVINDGVAEPMERLLVRLISPGGGATLGDRNTASLYLSDPGAPAEAGFDTASVAMAERGFATVIATVRRSGSASVAASVDFSMTGGDADPGVDFSGSTSGTLSWDAGDADPRTIEFLLADDGVVEGDETIEVTLGNPVGITLNGVDKFTATIRDGRGSNVAPNAIAGGSQTLSSGSQVTLNGSQSNDPDGDALAYEWTQISGTGVTLSDAGMGVASFMAPTVSSDTLLQFRLTVTDPAGLSDSATTSVTVTKPGGGGDPQGGGSGGGSLGLLSLLALAAARLRRRFSKVRF